MPRSHFAPWLRRQLQTVPNCDRLTTQRKSWLFVALQQKNTCKPEVSPYNSEMLHCNIVNVKHLPSFQPPRKDVTMITVEQITAANQSNLDAVTGLTTKTFAGFEKLVELNLAATKAVLAESFAHAQSMLAIKDAQELIALQSGLMAPAAEKAAAYGRHVYGIAVETTTEYTKAVEAKAAEGQKAFTQAFETMTKNAPAGTESAVAVLKSAMASSQSAIESAQSAAKQAISLAESNVTAVTEQALSAAAAVTKKA